MFFGLRHIVFTLFGLFYVVSAARRDPTFTKIFDGVVLLDTTSFGILPEGPFGERVLFSFLE